MNSLILCEGKSDCILLQYYLEKVHLWNRIKKSSFHAVQNSWSNLFEKSGNSLTISETKGCDRIIEGLNTAIIRNQNAAPNSVDDFYDKIIIFTDNDEVITSNRLIQDISNALKTTSVSFTKSIQKNVWNKGTVNTIEGIKEFELYIMLIPFDENGALETYLLSCISKNDAYDKTIIDKGNTFVEMIDPQKKYLNHRRLLIKSKFDVYFSVRTASDQFSERRDILKSVAWEQYDDIRKDFSVFNDLG